MDSFSRQLSRKIIIQPIDNQALTAWFQQDSYGALPTLVSGVKQQGSVIVLNRQGRIKGEKMRRRLPAVIWSTLFLMWLVAFVMLISLVHSKAGMGDGLVEECMRQKTLENWSRDGQISAR